MDAWYITVDIYIFIVEMKREKRCSDLQMLEACIFAATWAAAATVSTGSDGVDLKSLTYMFRAMPHG